MDFIASGAKVSILRDSASIQVSAGRVLGLGFGVLFLRLRVGVGDVASGFKAEGVGLGFKTAGFRSSGSRVQHRV